MGINLCRPDGTRGIRRDPNPTLKGGADIVSSQSGLNTAIHKCRRSSTPFQSAISCAGSMEKGAEEFFEDSPRLSDWRCERLMARAIIGL